VQSRPAQELDGAPLQVKILGQYGLNIPGLGRLIHGLAELNYATEFVIAAILRVGQYELSVVFGGHG
jgi:hypothetical protein